MIRRRLLLVPFFLIGAYGNDFPRDESTQRQPMLKGSRRLDVVLGNSKTVIFTFYQEVNAAEGGGTGMTREGDKALLDLWTQEWTAAGWIPRILSMEDARQHPHYRTVNGMINSLPLKTYERMCFIRWLAMSNQPGGGFLADYDTFPLAWVPDNGSLPNGGRMTVHEQSQDGGVPSLVSANEEEWFRFVWAIVENAKLHQGHWSDMKAMQELYRITQEEAFVLVPNVLPALTVLHGRGFDDETCQKASQAHAIHFSHYSVDKGVTPEGTGSPDTRASIAKEWLDGWRTNCKVTTTRHETITHQTDTHVQSPAVRMGELLNLHDPVDPQGDNPIIFTFYTQVDENDHTMGMSVDDHKALIASWAQTWQEMGWDPRVLTIDNAKQHPEFSTFDGMLNALPFRKIDRICFYRWLAMGMVNGGWLSDYDTFPLDRVKWRGTGDARFLPNSGKLTVHEKTKNGGVPSLVSGDAEEWFRLAKAQVDNAKAQGSHSHWSDMQAMQDIYQKSNAQFYAMEDNVVMGDKLLRNNMIDHDQCLWLRPKYAVHFSHYATNGQEQQDAARQRAKVGRDWILAYRQACAAYSEN